MIDWNHENAAHLLRRAGFGGRPDEIDAAVAQGLDATIDELFAPDPVADDLPPDVSKLRKLQGWWIARMVETSSPLRERLTLFFHNHFATGFSKGGPAGRMHRQNQTLRTLGLGRFRDLVLAIARDPAMLFWLDNRTNVKGNPNENFARELMELFTTGVVGQDGQPIYTELDVSEGARAFTGWTTVGGEFVFDPSLHDGKSKTFLGTTGNLDGTDVIDVLAYHPATARRIPMKLIAHFARPIDLDDPVLDEFEALYFAHDTAIEPLLRHLFAHGFFYDAASKRSLVKGPAELLVGALRVLGAEVSGKASRQKKLGRIVENMGQALFEPPSVFGWDEGLAWVEAAGLHQRAIAAQWIADKTKGNPKSHPVKLDLVALFGDPFEWPGLDAAAVVARILDRLGPIDAAPATVAALVEYLETDAKGEPAPFVLTTKSIEKKGRGLLALALSLPEFQVA